MRIKTHVSSIDGETFETMATPSPRAALAFLKRADHEGASVSVIVRLDDDDAYHALEAIDDRIGLGVDKLAAPG